MKGKFIKTEKTEDVGKMKVDAVMSQSKVLDVYGMLRRLQLVPGLAPRTPCASQDKSSGYGP